MADFVAVIRKAVDGLANNTPENRAKVYDKARGAVQRQLESMKPRPPEELLRRQMLKLDAAIEEVDSEYAEALPPLASESEEHYSPVAADEVYHQEASGDAALEDAPDDHAEVAPAAAVYHDEDVVADAAAPADEPVAIYDAQEADVRRDAVDDVPQEPVNELEPASRAWPADDVPSAEDEWRQQEDDTAFVAPAEKDEPYQTLETGVEPEETFVSHGDDYRRDEEPVAAPEPEDAWYQQHALEEPEAEKATVHPNAAYTFGARPNGAEPEAPAKAEDFSSYFDDAVVDFPQKPGATPPALPRADEDPFDPIESDDYAKAKVSANPRDEAKERTPWDDLEDLIGYDGAQKSGESSTAAYDAGNSGFSGNVGNNPYLVEKKPRRNYAGLLLAVLGLLLVAAGGYALWSNRNALNDMVGGLVQSAQPETASQTGAPGTPEQTPAVPETPAVNPVPSVAGGDGSVSGSKFTQRLLADGTEKDEGPAAGAAGQPMTAEGQSVYEQNEAPPAAENGATPPVATGGATAPASPNAPQTPPVAAAAPVAGATPAPVAGSERMFLYEEVLGQTVPTAIEGSVSWSLQQEPDADGKPEPTVQGNISIPGRGLSALITFKRNSDPSLPASHLIEIVFSVSPGFEGGAIDSVQRVAMKRTEQDRGDALIAVPAKITDDFHMIALNDFPDARATNLQLLTTRNWIDIPVSYRNGRRALLTMQKGAEGVKAFDTALKAWASLGPSTTGQ